MHSLVKQGQLVIPRGFTVKDALRRRGQLLGEAQRIDRQLAGPPLPDAAPDWRHRAIRARNHLNEEARLWAGWMEVKRYEWALELLRKARVLLNKLDEDGVFELPEPGEKEFLATLNEFVAELPRGDERLDVQTVDHPAGSSPASST